RAARDPEAPGARPAARPGARSARGLRAPVRGRHRRAPAPKPRPRRRVGGRRQLRPVGRWLTGGSVGGARYRVPMPTARNGDVELHYDVRGPEDGEVMLLVMGIGAQLIAWREGFVDLLVDHGYRVVRF